MIEVNKLKKPLKIGNKYIYPLTDVSQVIMEDGVTRLPVKIEEIEEDIDALKNKYAGYENVIILHPNILLFSDIQDVYSCFDITNDGYLKCHHYTILHFINTGADLSLNLKIESSGNTGYIQTGYGDATGDVGMMLATGSNRTAFVNCTVGTNTFTYPSRSNCYISFTKNVIISKFIIG